MTHLIHSTPIGELGSVEVESGRTVQSLFEQLCIDSGQPVVCLYNSTPLLRKDWGNTVHDGDCTAFIQLPLGGGGGKKSIIRTVAMVAIMAASMAIPVLGPMIGMTAGAAALLGAAVSIGGMLLVNFLLPPDKPHVQNQISPEEASPTYSITGRGNKARLGAPIPRIYGYHIVYPDLASTPYTVNIHPDSQYLYQLMVIGLGEYDVQQVRLDDTPVWDKNTGYSTSFEEVEIEIYEPGEKVTLFPTVVDTSKEITGQELKVTPRTVFNDVDLYFEGNMVRNRRQTNYPTGEPWETTDPTINADYKCFTSSGGGFIGDFTTCNWAWRVIDYRQFQIGEKIQISGTVNNNGTYTIVDIPGADGIIVQETFNEEWTVGSTISDADNSWLGPFIATVAGRGCTALELDFSAPGGLYWNDKTTGAFYWWGVSFLAQARRIDDGGSPLENWIQLDHGILGGSSFDPKNWSFKYEVPLGRYEVRIKRVLHHGGNALPDHSSSDFADTAKWTALKAYIPTEEIYENVTLLAMRIRASDQLSGSLAQKVNAIVTGKVPIWTGTEWTDPLPTRSPAWAAADVLMNNIYGGGISANRIDLNKLLELESKWDSLQTTFDAVYDTKRSVWEAEQQVLKAGRAQPIMVAGIITFTRDEYKPIARGLFDEGNIQKKSLMLTHILQSDNTPDDMIIEYMDERTWQSNEVLCTRDPSGVAGRNPARIRIFGITNRLQAWREGMYQVLSNTHRRVFTTLTTEMEGRLLMIGDTVRVQHTMPKWGQSGEVMEQDGMILYTSNSVMFDPDMQNYVTFRMPDNSEFGHVKCYDTGNDYEIRLDEEDLLALESRLGITLDSFMYTDDEKGKTRYILGAGANSEKRFLVIGTRAKGEYMDVSLVNDAPELYEIDNMYPPEEVGVLKDTLEIGPGVVTGVEVAKKDSSSENPVTLEITYDPTAGTEFYVVQASTSPGVWSTVAETSGLRVIATVPAGDVGIRVSSVIGIRGAWTSTSGYFGTPVLQPAPLQGLEINARTITWDDTSRANTYKVEGFYFNSLEGLYSVPQIQADITDTTFVIPEFITDVCLFTITPTNKVGAGVAGLVFYSPHNIGLTGSITSDPYNVDGVNTYWQSAQNATSYNIEIYENNELVKSDNVTGVPYHHIPATDEFRIHIIPTDGVNIGITGMSTVTIPGLVLDIPVDEGMIADYASGHSQRFNSGVIYDDPERGEVLQDAVMVSSLRMPSTYTISMYVRVDDANPRQVFVECDSCGFGVEGSKIKVQHNQSEPVEAPYGTADWLHLCVTFDFTNTVRIYVDGVEQGSGILGSIEQTQSEVTFSGQYIDDIKVYSRALSVEEIAKIS